MQYLPAFERKRAQAWRAAHPDAPPTAVERALERQAASEGRAQVKADAEARAEARAATIPEHERRPINAARLALEHRLQQDRPGNRQPKAVLESLRRAAKERDAEIDAEMAARKRTHLLAHDPDVQNAVYNAECALKTAAPEDREERARALAIAQEGNVQGYWEEARRISAAVVEREREKQADAAGQRSAAQAAWAAQKERADRAAAELRESMAALEKSLTEPYKE